MQFVSLSALNTRFKIELLCSGTTADVVWVLLLEGGDDASRLNSFQGFQGSISSPESLTLWMCRISCQHYSFSTGSNSAGKQQIMYEASPQVVFIYFIPLQVLCFSASHSGSSASHFLCISFSFIFPSCPFIFSSFLPCFAFLPSLHQISSLYLFPSSSPPFPIYPSGSIACLNQNYYLLLLCLLFWRPPLPLPWYNSATIEL